MMMKSITMKRADGSVIKYAVNNENEGLFTATANTGWSYRQWQGGGYRVVSLANFRRKLRRLEPGARMVRVNGW